MAVANAISAIGKMIQSYNLLWQQLFWWKGCDNSGNPHASFQIAAGECEFARINEIAIEEGLLWLELW